MDFLIIQNINLEAFGYSRYKVGFRAAGALLAYIWENTKESIKAPKILLQSRFLYWTIIGQ